MVRPALKIADPPAPARRTRAGGAIACALAAAAAVATFAGADVARRPFDAAPLAEAALARALASGDARDVATARETLDARLRSTPLDPATRVIAASLLVESEETAEARDEAARQALASVRLVPYDQWVARGAAIVLARCGRPAEALAQIRRTFSYAPDDAADALLAVEPMIDPARLEDAVPADPRDWLALSSALRRARREPEADARLDALLARWPGDLDALRVAAGVAAGRERPETIARLVPADLPLADVAANAPLFAFRARTRSVRGDAAGARADALHAVALSRSDPWVLVLAGDALVAADPATARDLWTRAAYALEPRGGDALTWVHLRLARLDEREGRAADALRRWRSILAARPDSDEARRRIAELTGESAR